MTFDEWWAQREQHARENGGELGNREDARRAYEAGRASVRIVLECSCPSHLADGEGHWCALHGLRAGVRPAVEDVGPVPKVGGGNCQICASGHPERCPAQRKGA